jgi:hypothetical protein
MQKTIGQKRYDPVVKVAKKDGQKTCRKEWTKNKSPILAIPAYFPGANSIGTKPYYFSRL